jgi:hypothetical protein
MGIALRAAVAASLVSAAAVAFMPTAQAQDPVCPYGTYWNPVVVRCLPWGVNPVVGPAGPVGVGGVAGPVGPGPIGPGGVVGPVGPGPVGPGGIGPR